MSSNTISSDSSLNLNVELFYDSLREKVSANTARLLLNTALLETGLKGREGELNLDEAKYLCLALIKQGGPCFKIGRSIYRQYLQ